jgi:hypothetical protein
LTNRLQEELSIITASFTLAGAVAGGGIIGVATKVAPVVEEKTTFTLLLILLLFLCLYYSYNMNTRKEK